MLETFIIWMVMVVILLVFKDEIMLCIGRFLIRFFPELEPELDNVVSPSLSLFEKGVLIFFIVLFVLFAIGCIINAIRENREDKRAAVYREEQEEVRQMFLSEFALDKDIFEKSLKEIVSIKLLSEPVKENFYHYRNTTDSRSQWGVYIGRYFLRCNFTLQTIRLAKLLRANGIEVKRDLNCSFDKE